MSVTYYKTPIILSNQVVARFTDNNSATQSGATVPSSASVAPVAPQPENYVVLQQQPQIQEKQGIDWRNIAIWSFMLATLGATIVSHIGHRNLTGLYQKTFNKLNPGKGKLEGFESLRKLTGEIANNYLSPGKKLVSVAFVTHPIEGSTDRTQVSAVLRGRLDGDLLVDSDNSSTAGIKSRGIAFFKLFGIEQAAHLMPKNLNTGFFFVNENGEVHLPINPFKSLFYLKAGFASLTGEMQKFSDKLTKQLN